MLRSDDRELAIYSEKLGGECWWWYEGNSFINCVHFLSYLFVERIMVVLRHRYLVHYTLVVSFLR